MDYNGSNHMYLDEENKSTHDNNFEEYASQSELLLLFFKFLIFNY